MNRRALPWRERIWIVGPAALFFLANLVFFLGGRAVDASRQRSLAQDRTDAKGRYEKASHDLRRVQAEREHIENVRKAAAEFYSDRIGTIDRTVADTVAEIHQVCSKAGVTPHEIGYTAKDNPNAPLTTFTISFSVDGNYAVLRRLIDGFERDPRWLIVRSVQLNRKSEGAGEGTVALSLATYFYSPRDGSKISAAAYRSPR